MRCSKFFLLFGLVICESAVSRAAVVSANDATNVLSLFDQAVRLERDVIQTNARSFDSFEANWLNTRRGDALHFFAQFACFDRVRLQADEFTRDMYAAYLVTLMLSDVPSESGRANVSLQATTASVALNQATKDLDTERLELNSMLAGRGGPGGCSDEAEAKAQLMQQIVGRASKVIPSLAGRVEAAAKLAP